MSMSDRPVVAVALGEMVDLTAHGIAARPVAPVAAIAGCVLDVEDAGQQVGGDLVAGDPRLDVSAGGAGDLEDAAGICIAEPALEPCLPTIEANGELAAVAPGRAPTDSVCLDENDITAALGQLQSRSKAREAAAHDADVSAGAVAQRGI